jgi:type II secretory pathway pseudopilin PulG
MTKLWGLTLVEVLIAVGLIVFIILFLALRIFEARSAAFRLRTISNVKQLALAAHSYNDQFKRLPAAHDGKGSCHIALGPYYEWSYSNLVDLSDYSFAAKQDQQTPWTSYAANYYLFGSQNDAATDITAAPGFVGLQDPSGDTAPFGYSPLAIQDIRDGTSNAIMWVCCLARPAGKDIVVLGESSKPSRSTGPFNAWLHWEPRPWVADATCSSGRHAQSFHRAGMQVALADGGTRTLSAAENTKTQFGFAMLPNDNTRPEWER